MRTFIVAKMTLKMMTREPLVLIWNLGFPILVYHVTKFIQRDSFDQSSLQFFNTMIAYTIVMNCIYGIGLCLVGWREEGLLRTFVHGTRAQIYLVTGLVFGISALNALFTALMYFSCNMHASGVQFHTIIQNLCYTLLVSVVFGFGAVLLNKVPLRWKTLSTVVSIFGWLMMVESSLNRNVGTNQWNLVIQILGMVNPINFVRLFFNAGAGVLTENLFIIPISMSCLVLGLWATFRLSRRSCERR